MGFVNGNLRAYYAEGSKTLAYEIAEQLDWQLPDAVVTPIASGALFHKLRQGFDELSALGLIDQSVPQLIGGQAEGCQPVAAAFSNGGGVQPVRPETRVHSLAIGSPADGDFALSAARDTGGAIFAVAEDTIGSEMKELAETTGVFGETATGVALGALRRALAHGVVGYDSCAVLVVTGDGIKTPDAIPRTAQQIPTGPDAEALLARLTAEVDPRD